MRNIFKRRVRKPDVCRKCGGFGEVSVISPNGRSKLLPCPDCAPEVAPGKVVEYDGVPRQLHLFCADSEHPRDTQQKETSDKVPLDFVLSDMATEVYELGKVMAFGFKKYKQRCGWKTVDPLEYRGAVERHLNAYYRGEEIDPESGCSHLAHAAVNCLFMDHLRKPHKI